MKLGNLQKKKEQVEVERDLYLHECRKLRDVLMDVREQFEQFKSNQKNAAQPDYKNL